MVSFISKIKIANFSNFPSIKYFCKGFLFVKILHIIVCYCLNYGPSNLLFRFFRYHLVILITDRIDKNSRKLDNTFFWKLTAKEMFVEHFKFFDPPTTKWRPVKCFAKLNGNYILMAAFSKLRKYQTFALIELHNLSKGQLVDRIFKLWKSYVYDYRAIEHTIFEILTF